MTSEHAFIAHPIFKADSGKVENFLKGSLDSIPSPSPSVKIQIMGGKVCLRCKGKTLLGVVITLLKTNSDFLRKWNGNRDLSRKVFENAKKKIANSEWTLTHCARHMCPNAHRVH